jgi:hypothetical protein
MREPPRCPLVLASHPQAEHILSIPRFNSTVGWLPTDRILTFATMAPNMSAPKTDVVAEAQAAAPVFDKVNWKKSPNMRKLYFYAAVLCIASATTGYDG